MSIFTGLPKVATCCLCCSLKVGSILIAIYTLLSFGASCASFALTWCGQSEDVINIVGYVMLGINCFAFIASLLFLFGILKHIPELATIFMYALLFAIIVNIVYIIWGLVLSITNDECSRYISIIAPAVSVVLWFYFILVVNSYEELMLD